MVLILAKMSALCPSRSMESMRRLSSTSWWSCSCCPRLRTMRTTWRYGIDMGLTGGKIIDPGNVNPESIFNFKFPTQQRTYCLEWLCWDPTSEPSKPCHWQFAVFKFLGLPQVCVRRRPPCVLAPPRHALSLVSDLAKACAGKKTCRLGTTQNTIALPVPPSPSVSPAL